MNMKKTLAALLSTTMALSSQIAVPMSVSAADTVTAVTTAPTITTTSTAAATTLAKAVTTTEATTFKAPDTTVTEATTFKAPDTTVTEVTTFKAASSETESEVTTTAVNTAVTAAATTTVTSAKEKLPRVQLEYSGIEVTEAYEDIIVLKDGKKLFVGCGEKVKYKDMFKKGNKLDIKGEFAYNKEQDMYCNCTAEIALTECTDKDDEATLTEKYGKLPHIELEYWGCFVIEADKDTISLENGMKVNVSSGKQHYTDMFKPGNWISLVGEFAYNAEDDTYYNIDSKMWLHQYVDVYTFYSEEEEENFVYTTTFVEDVTTAASTTTTSLEYEEVYHVQPEGKYPIHYHQRVQYKLEKEITVDKIKEGGIIDADGTKWVFDSRNFNIYDLGKGDKLRVYGLFDYCAGEDEFYGTDGGYEVIAFNDNYEQYASIPILEEFEHRITDKRLSYYDDIEYKVDFDDVTILDISDREIFTLSNGYKMAFCHTSPDFGLVHVGDHIKVSGWFTYHYDADILSSSYHKWDAENCGKFTIISRDMTSVHKERAKSVTPGFKYIDCYSDVEVMEINGNILTVKDPFDEVMKMSFLLTSNPDLEYVRVGDRIIHYGNFRYNWLDEYDEGATNAYFEIVSRKVIPDDKQKKDINLENKGIKIKTVRNGVITADDGTKYYIAPSHDNDSYDVKAGDTITVNGKFDYWEDEKTYVSYSADVKLGEPAKLSEKPGDSNVDGSTDLADSVLIMQTIANPEKYILSSQGRINADIEGNHDGVTSKDALKIQRITLKLEK